MTEAILIDFYGTIVFEDGEKINKISHILYKTDKQVGIYDNISLSFIVQ